MFIVYQLINTDIDVKVPAMSTIPFTVVPVVSLASFLSGVYRRTEQQQHARIAAVREASELVSIPIFINARSDSVPTHHNDNHLEEALRRASAYAEYGANGFFAPGLRDKRHIEKLCKLSPIPVNIMVLPDTPSSNELAELGVAGML